MTKPASWAEIAALIESVLATPEVLAEAVADARAASRHIAALESADISRYTRDLMMAATRAIAARRGPTEVELSFVADLAVTRARQGVPIADVLGAVHAASRCIWSAAARQAATQGVSPMVLLQVRELFDDWSEAVRQRLLQAYRSTEAHPARGRYLAGDVINRLLQGGSTASLAANDTRLNPDAVFVGVVVDAPDWAHKHISPRDALMGSDGGEVVLVASHLPFYVAGEITVGVAGPGHVRDVPQLRRWASTAAAAAAETGRVGGVHIAEIAPVAAVIERSDLAGVLAAHYADALAGLGGLRDAALQTVRRWLELGRDSDAAARVEYVHANTVRNRVNAVQAATGLDPQDTFDALTLWWLAASTKTSAAIRTPTTQGAVIDRD